MEALTREILENPLFLGLDPEKVLPLVEGARTETFEPGQYIFKEGLKANSIYQIRRGRVALETFTPERGPVTVQTLTTSEELGWSWFVDPYVWRFDARAVEMTRVLVLDAEKVRQLCRNDPAFGYVIAKRVAFVVAERLHWTRIQLLDIYGVRAES
ncbi:MAG: cyclic nucleotide-binding domain-containing protein [Planctomycetota bacterium]|jgi:CRP-like cAMP-binding protein|nr:cyclic nucleotide-binding domain-containing protein [Planctomycetota bacterium]